MADKLLEVKDLIVTVHEASQEIQLVKGISFDVAQEEIVSLVGGSGCGKTTTALSLMRLLAAGLKISRGQAFFEGQDLFAIPENSMRLIRGKRIGMVFQEPLTALNPVFTIADQINEVLETHTTLNHAQRKARVQDLLNIVGVPDPKRVGENYPHQLSGGLRQRAMIAQAIAGDPKLIIADEPTSNLDVTIQAKIIDLFRDLRKKLKLSILLITHDLGMVEHLSDKIIVMKQGRIVESGKCEAIFKAPQQKYTQELLEASRG